MKVRHPGRQALVAESWPKAQALRRKLIAEIERVTIT